jgi:histidinol-phosphate aminotransferase
MSGYVPGEQPQDKRYIKLNTNENPYPPSPQVMAALKGFDPERLRLYPDPVASELCEVAAGLQGLERSWVIAGNGSDDLLTLALRTYVDQGGAIACFEPSYSLYPVLAQIQGARTLEIPLTEDFQIPENAVELAGEATLLFLTRPNAPTGTCCDLQRVEKICQEFAGIVWIDEAYADFASDNCLDFVRRHANVIVSRTVSKSYSLAGVRLGLAYAQPQRIAEMLKVKDSYNVNMLTQVIGLAALQDQAYQQETVGRIRRTRERVRAQLQELGFEVGPSEANFLFAKSPVPAAELVAELRHQGILVRYFPGKRTGEFLRITIGTETDMARFVEVVSQIVNT